MTLDNIIKHIISIDILIVDYRGFPALGRPVLRDICASRHGKPLLRPELDSQ